MSVYIITCLEWWLVGADNIADRFDELKRLRTPKTSHDSCHIFLATFRPRDIVRHGDPAASGEAQLPVLDRQFAGGFIELKAFDEPDAIVAAAAGLRLTLAAAACRDGD